MPRTHYLMEEELGRLLRGIEQVTRPQTRKKFQTLFLILVNFGPRIGEAVRLRARDVDLVDGSITFPTLKRWEELEDGTRVRVPMTRTLPLAPGLAQELGAYIEEHDLRGDDLLFPTPRSRKQAGKYAWEVFKRALHVAGLFRHYRLHDLRHSALTRLADKTRDPALVRDVAGHSSIATSNIYIHTVQLREKMMVVKPILPGTVVVLPRADEREEE